jgi:hypothetical protein
MKREENLDEINKEKLDIMRTAGNIHIKRVNMANLIPPRL